jgi:hypothetical protein
MTAANKLLSRKLLAALCSVAVIAVNRKWGLGLGDEDVRSIADIALTAIGSQAGIDLAERLLPGRNRAPADGAAGDAHAS